MLLCLYQLCAFVYAVSCVTLCYAMLRIASVASCVTLRVVSVASCVTLCYAVLRVVLLLGLHQ